MRTVTLERAYSHSARARHRKMSYVEFLHRTFFFFAEEGDEGFRERTVYPSDRRASKKTMRSAWEKPNLEFSWFQLKLLTSLRTYLYHITAWFVSIAFACAILIRRNRAGNVNLSQGSMSGVPRDRSRSLTRGSIPSLSLSLSRFVVLLISLQT